MIAWAIAFAVTAAPVADKIAIVPVIVGRDESSPLSPAKLHALLEKVVVYRAGLEILSEEEGGPIDCAGERQCIARHVRVLGADLALIVVVNTMVDPNLIAFELVDAKSERVIARQIGARSAEDLEQSVVARARGLFDQSGHLEIGRVLLEGNLIDAIVEVDGSPPSDASSTAFALRPGRHDLRVRKSGSRDVDLAVDVIAGETKSYRIDLVPATPRTESTLVESPFLWGAIGLVVLGGVAAAIAITHDGGECLCIRGADQICSGC